MAATTIPFLPESSGEVLDAIPARPAVFMLRGHDPQAEPYIGKTSDLRRRLKRLLNPPLEQSKRLNLRERVAEIAFTTTGSDFESWLVLYRTMRSLFPRKYRQRMKLAAPPMIRIAWENSFPRAYVTHRLSRIGSRDAFYGPFPSRAAAEKYLNEALDLFRLRRCVEDLNPDPAFPGCIYSEMKMCLAPCFKGCTQEEYAREADRVSAFFDSRGNSLVAEIASERDRASERLDFEEAAALHSRIEKAGKVSGLALEAVHRVDRLDAIVVQPAERPEHVALFRISQGMISPAALFDVTAMQHPNQAAGSTSLHPHPRLAEPVPETKTVLKTHNSLETRIQERIFQIVPERPGSATELGEHLALLKRWYYKSPRLRTGEIFFASAGAFPWRRIVRGISRVYRGERETSVSSE